MYVYVYIYVNIYVYIRIYISLQNIIVHVLQICGTKCHRNGPQNYTLEKMNIWIYEYINI